MLMHPVDRKIQNNVKKESITALLLYLLVFIAPVDADTLAIDISMVADTKLYTDRVDINADPLPDAWYHIGDGSYFTGPFSGAQMWRPADIDFRTHLAFNSPGGYMKFEVLRDLAGIDTAAIISATLTVSTFHREENIPAMVWNSPPGGHIVGLQIAPYASAVDWDSIDQPVTVSGAEMPIVQHTVYDPYPFGIPPDNDGNYEHDYKYLEDISFDVTPIVRSWVATEYDNHGFSLDLFENNHGLKYYMRVFDQDHHLPLPPGANFGRLSVVVEANAVPTIAVTDTVLPVDNLSLDFDEVGLGFNQQTSVSIRNISVVYVNIGFIAAVDTLGSSFSIPVEHDNCSNQSLAANTSCEFILVFTPVSLGEVNDSFDIASNDHTNPSLTFNVSGTGFYAPDIEVTNSSTAEDDLLIGFGRVSPPIPAEQTVTVRNVGAGDLIIASIAQENALITPYSIVSDDCSGQTIAVSSSCTLTVKFETGDFIGEMSDSFDIVSNDPDESSVKVSVVGEGTYPVISGSAGPVDLLLVSLFLFWTAQCKSRQWRKKAGNFKSLWDYSFLR